MYKLKTIETFDDVQDYDIFTDIVFDNFHHLNNVPHLHHTKAEIKKVLMSKKFLGLFVFNSESKIIGYLIGEFMTLNDGRKIYYVSYFYVVTKYRKLGIGSHLINAIINNHLYYYITRLLSGALSLSSGIPALTGFLKMGGKRNGDKCIIHVVTP